MTRATWKTPTRRAVALRATAALALPALATGRSRDLPAAALRTIDPADEDFTDLAPLARAIGRARVVQLGEPSHGAGAAFSAKARIVKFLHQRLGFDLLIWESGLYDVGLTQAALRAGEDPVAAARRGVFGLWANAAEVRPLFAYAQASTATGRPLDMAGFDLQVTASGTRERFAADLTAFGSAPRDAQLQATGKAQAEAAVSARQRLFATRFSEASDLAALTAATDALLTMVRANQPAFGGGLSTEFMVRCIENMQVDALQRFESARSAGAAVARENRRDARNFENLRWLLERQYPGRKAIIWAHNAHIMNAYYAPDFRAARAQGQLGDMKPTGVFLHEWLSRGVYTIGVTAYEGAEGLATGSPKTEVPPAPAGSLEALLHAQSQPYLFLDLREATRRDPTMLRAAASARFPKYDVSPTTDLVRAYDGLLYIDRMTAATALKS